MPPETNNEPDTENDAAKKEENSKERPEDQSGCYRWYQCAQLPPGSRSRHVTPGSQRGPQAASCASHLSFLSSGHPLRDGQDRAGNRYLHRLPTSRQIKPAGGPKRVITLSDPAARDFGVTLSEPTPDRAPGALDETMALLAEGRLRLRAHTTKPMQQAAEAHRQLESGTVRVAGGLDRHGGLVVTPDADLRSA
jgi:hypothetical protein